MSSIREQKKALVEEMMRETIREAAIRVIRENGWQGTTMSKIAKAAGVSKGTLYNYFEGKLDMLVFVGDPPAKELMAQLREVRESTLSPTEKMEAIFRVMIRHLDTNRKITACFVDAHMNDTEARDYLHKHMHCSPWHLFLEIIQETVQKGVEEGIFYPLHPAVTACLFQHNFFLLSKLLAEQGKPYHHVPFDTIAEEDIVNTFKQLLLNGLIRANKEALQL
ncbi:MAG TPA: TetR/AcrR family transcriptional regulator [Synergistaceae bacterium]|nr:TetR/AcrR family transcriptional regulator [Synergistaceae bacterium]HPJ26760.1 TetR/AcrR family transcriptional regulator [Synergistaceae bacterium]HPQ36481.1 TetR/AcrR family transcriptional regulator [Synergistaceae bacterium]